MAEPNSFWTLEEEPTMFTIPYDMRGPHKSFTMEEEKKDTDSVGSNHHAESVVSEVTERDDQSSVGGDKIDASSRAIPTDERRGRSRKAKRKTRRKRGESLERQISQLIMGAVCNNTWDSQVEAEEAPTSEEDPASVEFILQDLVDPCTLELIQGMDRTDNYLKPIQDDLGDSQWQDFGDSDFAEHVTTGKDYSTNLDLQLATIAEAVSHRRHNRNLAREADFDEYGDPSLEINFSEGMDNDDGSTHYDNEQSQPDDELGPMSGLTLTDIKEGQFGRCGAGSADSFDSWGWHEPNGDATSARENRSTSPSASNLQERNQVRTKTGSEFRDTREFRERDASPHEGNSATRSAKSTDAAIFKRNYEEWSPMMMAELPFEGIRFSDTLVDPDEFERIGSVDEEGFLVNQVTRHVAKPSKVKGSASNRQNDMDPHFERRSVSSACTNSLKINERKFVGNAYPYSPDCVTDYPNDRYCGPNRSVDPPGSRESYGMDDWSESSTIRIAI